MIKRYNQNQVLKAVCNFALAAIAYSITFCFFDWGFREIAYNLEYHVAVVRHWFLVGTAVAIVTASGLHRAWSGKGHKGYHEFPLRYQVERNTTGAIIVDQELHSFTGTVYIISEIALAGPLQIWRAFDRLRSLLPNDPALEARLASLHLRIKEEAKWLDAAEFAEEWTDIEVLVRMGLLEYSPTTGRLHAR